MSDGEEGPTVEELADEISRMEAKFNKLAKDFTNLRYDINDLEELVDRRT